MWRNFLIAVAVFVVVALLIAINTTNQRLLRLEEGRIRIDPTDEFATIGSVPSTIISFDLPEKLTFAGDSVPMYIQDVRERLDKELHINSYLHGSTIFMIKRAQRWLPQIDSILKLEGIPSDFKYLPLVESALLNDISPKEAVGFWQIIKSAGKENGLEITDQVDERYDPLKSTRAACRYLRTAYNKFHNWTMVAASYNRGMAGMQKSIDTQKVSSYYDLYLNDETSRYVFRILALKEIMNNPLKYGFDIKPQYLYQQERLRYVEVSESIKNLVDFSIQQGINYKLLKRHNPWLREEKLTIHKNKTYHIAIPILK